MGPRRMERKKENALNDTKSYFFQYIVMQYIISLLQKLSFFFLAMLTLLLFRLFKSYLMQEQI